MCIVGNFSHIFGNHQCIQALAVVALSAEKTRIRPTDNYRKVIHRCAALDGSRRGCLAPISGKVCRHPTGRTARAGPVELAMLQVEGVGLQAVGLVGVEVYSSAFGGTR